MTNLRETLSGWLNRKVSLEEMAVALDVSLSTVKRRSSEGFAADDAITLARHFGVPAVAFLVSCGFLRIKEAEEGIPEAGRAISLREYTDLELAREVLRRVEVREGDETPPDEPADYVLAALDRDDDVEVEAQQEEA